MPSDWIRVPFSLDPSVAVDTFLSPWSEAWEVKRTDHLDPGIFKDTFNFILPPNLEIFIDPLPPQKKVHVLNVSMQSLLFCFGGDYVKT